jgi:hypothetical protein
VGAKSQPSTEEHARLEIGRIIAIARSAKYPYAFLNITYSNIGNVASIGRLSRASIVPIPRDKSLSDAEVKLYRDKNSHTFTDNDLRLLREDERECPPNDGKIRYFSVPEHQSQVGDVLTREWESVISGTRTIYVFLTMLYRDQNMGDQMFGATETCFYFSDTFDVQHECGNRAMVKTTKELTSADPNDPPYR